MYSIIHKALLVLVTGFVLCASFSIQALAAHPSDGYETGELQPNYGKANYGTPPEWGFDDIQFTRPYPNAASLDHAERYMLAGLVNYQDGNGRAAWFDETMAYVTTYYSQHKSFPSVLTEEVMRGVCANEGECTSADFDWHRSPIHGGYPRLDAKEFSPGDMYIRVLSDSEIERLCQVDKNLDAMWHDHMAINPITGERWSAHLWSPVMYVRMYGRNGVLLSRIYYTFGKNK